MLILVNRISKTFVDLPTTHGLGFLVSPSQVCPSWLAAIETLGLPWACDNDAFSGFDEGAFRRMLDMVRDMAPIFVTAPDVVGDARSTIGLFDHWLPEFIARELPVALVGQDGMEDCDVDYWLGMADAFFVGGSTAWKLSAAAADLCREAKGLGKWVHMGRVNTRRRLKIAHDIGCDSVDGSCFSWFPRVKIAPAVRYLGRLDRHPKLF